MGSIFSAIGGGINAIISATAGVLMAIVSTITMWTPSVVDAAGTTRGGPTQTDDTDGSWYTQCESVRLLRPDPRLDVVQTDVFVPVLWTCEIAACCRDIVAYRKVLEDPTRRHQPHRMRQVARDSKTCNPERFGKSLKPRYGR
ncbi:hypothetical protein F5I97DRAFT_1829199 [Phlebopus sp. FC_14]|nr:hypothetical protein F5I97DRAFT_1829199 [Phlebopus sp. FC_14]